jgi:hypothetical protein
MNFTRFNILYSDLELEYIYDNRFIYYEEAIEMIKCVCQNTRFPRSIKKIQAILDSCARIRSDKRWRDDTILPRIFDYDEKIDVSKYRTKVGNPSANSESRAPTDDIWIRSPEGWVVAEKKCILCNEKKPYRFFGKLDSSIDDRQDICLKCEKNELVEIEYI